MNKGIMAGIVVVIVVAAAGFLLTSNKSALETQTEDAMMGNSDQMMANEESMESTTESMMEDDQSMMNDDQAMMENVTQFIVEGSPFKFEPSVLKVKEGQTVKVTFKNVEGMHDFVIDELDARTQVINTGEEETIEFVASKKGSFTYYCSVPGHREKGMEGTLIVE